MTQPKCEFDPLPTSRRKQAEPGRWDDVRGYFAFSEGRATHLTFTAIEGMIGSCGGLFRPMSNSERTLRWLICLGRITHLQYYSLCVKSPARTKAARSVSLAFSSRGQRGRRSSALPLPRSSIAVLTGMGLGAKPSRSRQRGKRRA